MKKLFSLVALAGMFMLMSFSFTAEEKQIPWCDSVDSACTGAANDTMTNHDFSMWEANCYYLECITVNGC